MENALQLGLLYAPVALGLLLSYRILKIADMTTDGSFTLGCAVSAMGTLAGYPYWALLWAAIAGVASGSVTAILQTKGNIPGILAGIITNTGLYTIHLLVMGFSANVSLLQSTTVFSQSRWIPLILIPSALGFLLFWFLKTRVGLSVRATGDNPSMVRSSSINPHVPITVGLCLSNGLVALSGGLLAQYQRTADINLGTGMVVTGLASVMLGDRFCPGFPIFGAILGSMVYRLMMAFALRLDIPSECFKLITAGIVALAIGLAGKRGQVC